MAIHMHSTRPRYSFKAQVVSLFLDRASNSQGGAPGGGPGGGPGGAPGGTGGPGGPGNGEKGSAIEISQLANHFVTQALLRSCPQ